MLNPLLAQEVDELDNRTTFHFIRAGCSSSTEDILNRHLDGSDKACHVTASLFNEQ